MTLKFVAKIQNKDNSRKKIRVSRIDFNNFYGFYGYLQSSGGSTRGLFGAVANDVEVALREGNGDVVAVEGVVDGFLDAAGEEVLLLDVHPYVDEEVDAAVTEVGEGDGDGAIGVYGGLASGGGVVADGLQGLDEEAANVVDVSAVGDADG